ncbi:hypothetical protein C8Q74DRAFT_1293209 [Fomes fomentarius]|nr:hypothetical protein C8Q74DRAFT_1293209 [Fomes fomentarius]
MSQSGLSGMPWSAAQSALYNSDLLSQIFEYFARPPHSGSSISIAEAAVHEVGYEELTLRSAARVCKAFVDPANRVLWRSIPSLLPLWLILPPLKRVRTAGYVEDISVLSSAIQYILADDITPAQWSRFREFAALIREVRMDFSSTGIVHPSVLAHISHLLKGERLLPRLHTLCWFANSPLDAHLLPILTPTLRRFELHCAYEFRDPNLQFSSEEDRAVAEGVLVRTICREAPLIEDIKLHRIQRAAPLRPLGALRHVRKLNLVDCCEFGEDDGETLRVLAGLENLEELTNVSVQFSEDETDMSPLPASGFHKLTTLGITGDVAAMPRLLGTVKGKLRRLRLRAQGTMEDWLPAFENMVPYVPCLLELELDVRNPMRTVSERWELGGFIGPFLQLGEVEELAVRTAVDFVDPEEKPFRLDVGDEDLEDIAKAWPKLKSISLDVHSQSAPSLRGVAVVAAECVGLETLLLPRLNTSVEAGLPSPLPVQRALRRLSVYEVEKVWITNRDAVGAVLWEMFPLMDRYLSAAAVPSTRSRYL